MVRKVCVFGVVGVLLAGGAFGQTQRVIITFRGRPDPGLVRGAGGAVNKTYHLIPACAATLPAPAVRALARNPRVLRVEPDLPVYAIGAKAAGKPDKPDKPGGGKPKPPPEQPPQVLPWGVNRIDAEYAWPIAGAGVKVAVLDTGIDQDHSDLQSNIKGGINFVERRVKGRWTVEPTRWDDDNGHGSHCAGIIGALANETGAVGVAPQASLYGVKVLDKSGSGRWSYVIAGLEWCVDNGMQVASMSLSGGYLQSVEAACANAYSSGVVLVAAAGNTGDDAQHCPAALPTVIAVSATDDLDNLAYFSTYGNQIELAAPGAVIFSTYKDGGYEELSGTSMACPHVAGAVALVLGVSPGLSPDEVRSLLRATSDDLGAADWDPFYGFGLVDAEEAATGAELGDD